MKNYRSIVDSGEIDLKPITAIVGRNSCGKSSFIRIFPLLKQTLERPISETLLWYGDYVDLGDYENAISRYSNEDKIEFSFTIFVNSSGPYYIGSSTKEKNFKCKISFEVKKEYFESIYIEYEDQNIKVLLEKDNKLKDLIVNGQSLDKYLTKAKWDRETMNFFPYIVVTLEKEVGELIYFRKNDIFHVLQAEIRKRISYSSKKESSINERFQIGSKDDILNELIRRKIRGSNDYTIETDAFLELNNLIVGSNVNLLLETINDTIRYEAQTLHYMKPIRAMVDRYYRVQGVSVSQLDADGSNLPMILRSLSGYKLKAFERWSKEKFGVVFSVKDKEGHVSLVMKNDIDDPNYINLADTGYGYSQMLPIVVLLWMIHTGDKYSYRRYSTIDRLIVIEQPELHLHPAYQAKMMDVFVNIVKEAASKNISLKIIFETHSETMINRLGLLIAYGKIDKEEVNVLVFNKENNITTVTSNSFNQKGLLLGWPGDFFAPEDVE